MRLNTKEIIYMKTRISVGIIVSMLLLTLPAAASDYTLGIFGNANEDDTINMQDVTYTELIILEYRDRTELADGKHDSKINMQDVTQIELIILGKEKELTFLDMADRIVTVDKPITRMIAYGQAIHQVIRDLDAEDRLVATDKDVQEVWSALFPELVGLPIWGSWKSMDYEAVLELEPEIFITLMVRPATELSAWQQEIVSKLEPAGIRVIAVGTRHPEELLITVRRLGYVLDQRAEAEEFIDFYSGVIDTVAERTENIPEDDKPRIAMANCRKYNLAVGGSGYNEYVLRAGGINIASDLESTGWGSAEVDPEWVIEQNPDVYVMRVGYNTLAGYAQEDAAVAEEVVDDILKTPELAMVSAIEDERMYLLEQSTTSAASFLCIGYLAKWFYPELFEDLDMKAIHQEYLDRFQHLDFDLDEQGVFMYPPLYGPALT